MTDPKIIERVQKLLRLAESSNVHEAATAAARAQELMERHRIDVATVHAEPSAIEDHRDRPLATSSRLPRWRVTLAVAVAEASGCRVYIRDAEGRRSLVVVGTRDDAANVLTLDAYLAGEVERLTRRLGRGQGRRWCTGFRLGAVTTLAHRLREARNAARTRARREAEARRAAGQTTALVRVDTGLRRLEERERDIEAFMRERLRLRRETRRRLRADADAYAQGSAAATMVRIDPRPRLRG